jgi:hypothetical protein
MMPEFSRLIAVDRVPPEGMTEHLSATPEERQALAKRFGLIAIHELSALLQLQPWRRGGIKITGKLNARVEQTCVVTLDRFQETLTEELTRYFAGQNAPGPTPAIRSVESLEEDEPDVISGGSIDLGEVVAESLGLAIDPYPRKPGAEFTSQFASDRSGPQSPFTALKALKRRTKGGNK